MKLKPTLIGLVLGIAVVSAGLTYQKWRDAQRRSWVTLYGFMGDEEFGIEARVIANTPGYIKIQTKNGKIIEFSGRYSVERR